MVFYVVYYFVSECQFGSVRLYNEQTGYNINGSLAITGILEVCVGEGGWATFCDEGVEAIDSNLLGFLQNGCNSMGYAGECFDIIVVQIFYHRYMYM